jgi:hydroxymethylbilane synthase
VRAAVTAERALLAAVGEGCGAVVGALADVVEDLDDEGRVVLRLFLRGVAATADDDLLRSSATAPYSAVSGSTVSDSVGEPTDAEKLGRQVAAELLDLAGGALGGRPSAARPGPTA